MSVQDHLSSLNFDSSKDLKSTCTPVFVFFLPILTSHVHPNLVAFSRVITAAGRVDRLFGVFACQAATFSRARHSLHPPSTEWPLNSSASSLALSVETNTFAGSGSSNSNFALSRKYRLGHEKFLDTLPFMDVTHSTEVRGG